MYIWQQRPLIDTYRWFLPSRISCNFAVAVLKPRWGLGLTFLPRWTAELCRRISDSNLLFFQNYVNHGRNSYDARTPELMIFATDRPAQFQGQSVEQPFATKGDKPRRHFGQPFYIFPIPFWWFKNAWLPMNHHGHLPFDDTYKSQNHHCCAHSWPVTIARQTPRSSVYQL